MSETVNDTPPTSPAVDNTLPVIDADQALVAKLKSEIQIDDRAALISFGDGAQRRVADFADRVLQQTKNKDLGDTGDLLRDILMKAENLDPASLSKEGFIDRMFGGAKAAIKRFVARYEEVAGQIETICLQVEKRRDNLTRDIAMLDNLHEETRSSIMSLSGYILAGKEFAATFKATELPRLQAAATAPGEPQESLLKAQTYQDAVQAVDRLEKRVFYLQQARQIGIQSLPQIRIVQSGNETLIESLNATLSLTIPAWKQKMILLLGLQHQKDALDLQNTVNEATNKMLRQASQMMKEQAIEIEQQSQEGIVQMETLQQVNKDLIDTINGVLAIQEAGSAKRTQAEGEMEQMTTQLRQVLSQATRA